MPRRRTALWVVVIVGFVHVGVAHADVVAAPATVEIGNILLGQSGAGTTVLSADSTFDNTIPLDVVPRDQPCPEFQVTSEQPFIITDAGNRTGMPDVTIQLMPQSPGVKQCTFSVITDSGKVGKVSVQVIGNGVAPGIALETPAITFGPTNVGATSEPMQVIAINSGTAPLHIDSASFTTGAGDFVATESPTTPIPAGDRVSWGIRCTPSVSGPRTGKFEIASDAFDDALVSVELTCNEDQAGPGSGGDHDPGPASGTLPDIHGGGCAAGDTTGGAAIAILVLVLRRRRTRSIAATAAATALCLIASAQSARADDIVVGVFDPTPSTSSAGFQLESADVGPAGTWAARIVASYATDLLVVDNFDGSMRVADRVIKRRSTLDVGGAYALFGRFEVGLQLPIDSQRGDTAPAMPAGAAYLVSAGGTALGDLTVHAKARVTRWSTLTAGAALRVTLPTSTAGQFTGAALPTVRALGLITWTPIARLALSANAGGTVRKTAVYGDALPISQGSGLDWGAGAAYEVVDRLWATGEVFGEIEGGRDSALATLHAAPAEALAGATYQLDSGIAVGAALGGGLGGGIGAPGVRGVVSLRYVAGGVAAAPAPAPRMEHTPEGAPDATGDRDRDGIPDAADQCPDEPEDRDGFQDEDGCPDPDNDRDGVPDARDRCPLEPETVNGYQDDDGCPDENPQVSPTKAAEDTFARGRALLQQGKYAAAAAQFEQSERLDPQFGTEYNLAVSYEKIGRLAAAWNLYRDLARRDSNAKRQAISAGLAAAIAARVPRIKLVLARPPAGVEVRLDGSSATALVGIATPVDLGNHEVVVTAPGFRTWHQTIAVTNEGKAVDVVVDLMPSGAGR